MRVVKEINWPELRSLRDLKPMAAIARLVEYLLRMRKVQAMRDQKLAQALNALDIQVVDSAPADPPDLGEPALVVYANGGTWRLYVYVDGGWRYCALT